VAIARALAPGPDVVLMDEPTGSLDVDSAIRVLGLVKWLNEALGQTIVIVTHNPEISELATRTFYIRGGMIYEQPPGQTLADRLKELKGGVGSGELKSLQLSMLKVKLEALERAASKGLADAEVIEAELRALERRISRLEKLLA